MLKLAIAMAIAAGGLRAPDRLTAGPAHQFLGALTPSGKELIFVSDEDSTTQIYVQDVARGVPRLLFDEVADVTWPRPSPDGKRLLYISYRTDAAGDLCVRDLGGKSERRCLTSEASAEVQAIWMPDGKSIAVVTRSGLHGDFELRRLALGGGEAEVLVKGNLSSPTVSPDGDWLAYVPVRRGSAEVGPSFLARAAGSFEIVRLGGKGSPLRQSMPLPGASAFPAFSVDGKWLYFTQFLNDTNLDGSIDGSDNGVIFRASFTDGRLGAPVQLTSARWSCQYPTPAADRLIATCLQAGSLDVFALPLDGSVPPEWKPAQIEDELSAAEDRWDKLLLLAHRKGGDAKVLEQTIRLHLELGEHESAGFYAGRLQELDEIQGKALAELVRHRKAERGLSRGMISSAFVRDARAQLERLGAIAHPLAAITRSEILDTLGEEEAARQALAAAAPKDEMSRWLYAERLLALYRGEDRLFELYRPIAEDDLGHAQVFVRELMRGAGSAERARRAEAWKAKVDAQSDLAFLLELERALADLSPENQEPVRERVFQIYRRNKDLARRKALVGATTARALAEDNEYLFYNFANSWVSYVPRERAERRNAERLFRDVVLERAYVSESRGNVPDARGNFYAVTLQTEALEAHAGFIEGRLTEKKDPAQDYAKFGAADVVKRYARAYMLARKLPAAKDLVQHDKDVTAAIAELQIIAGEAPQRPEVHQLWGYLAQQRWLRTGQRLAAVEANAHLLIALDLARDNPRLRAAILDSLARLQSSVGNHAIALGWFEERSRLPFTGALPRLSFCLALARAGFQAGDVTQAATQADGCVAQIAEDPKLARFRALAVDRSALYRLTAGDFAGAVERYTTLWALVEGASGKEAGRNRLTTRLGWGAALLGLKQARPAMAQVAAAEKLLAAGTPSPLEGPYGRWAPRRDAAPDFRLILLGMRAQAHYLAGEYAQATAAMVKRRDAYAKRFEDEELDEDRLELALCEGQLALYAHRQKDAARAQKHLEAGMKQWDAWSESTGTPIEDTGLALLAGYAELHLFAGVAAKALRVDLPRRLLAGYTELSKLRNPAWEPMRARFELYLTLMNLRRGP